MSIEIKVSKRPISYKIAMNFLNNRVNEIKKNHNKRELLWILEHPLTYTAGIRHQKSEIIDNSIKIIKTNRGGKITLHSPGQKVIYFVLNLNKRKKDIRKLISIIEDSIIEFLRINNINAERDKKNVGIWVNKKKIAAIGLRVTRWIAYHGCSINISNDLRKYQKIQPCGLSNKNVTSILNEKGKKIKNTNKNLANIFLKNLKMI